MAMRTDEDWKTYLTAWLIHCGTGEQEADTGALQIFDQTIMPFDDWEDDYNAMCAEGYFKERNESNPTSRTFISITEKGIAWVRTQA